MDNNVPLGSFAPKVLEPTLGAVQYKNIYQDIQHLPWVEKYRPYELENMVSHDNIISTLNNMIENQRFPHVILYGPPGTGKTSLIMSCAKKIFGDNYSSMILELNGSDDRGINVVREQIKEFACTRTIFNHIYVNKSDYKLVILDEADSMTYDAQFALRRVIEDFTNNTRFCIICNYLSKIEPALQSRCVIFKLGPINNDAHFDHIRKIANLEQINILDETLHHIVQLAEGDMRKSINLLQSLYMSFAPLNNNNYLNDNPLSINLLYRTIGYPHPDESKDIFEYICDTKNLVKESHNKLIKYKEYNNLAVGDILKEFTKLIINRKFKNITQILDNFASLETKLISNLSNDIHIATIIAIIKKYV